MLQNTTTERIDLPSCIRSNPLLISSSLRTWVIIGSISIFPFMYQSTIFGTSVRPRAPPNAVPFQTRPVTSWNGRVEISLPASATPPPTEPPQPRWQASSAWRITVVLPVQSKVKSAPPSVSATRCAAMSPSIFFGLTKWVMPKRRPHSSLLSLRSTPMILSAPTIRAPRITLSPIPPSPNTTTLAPGVTLAVLTTAPTPVVTPQPLEQLLPNGTYWLQ